MNRIINTAVIVCGVTWILLTAYIIHKSDCIERQQEQIIKSQTIIINNMSEFKK